LRHHDYCVTFDLWQTLIFDKSEEDHVRSRKRCEDLHKILSDLGFTISLHGLEEAHEESALRFQASWKLNKHLSTLDQIQLIVEIASGSNIPLPSDSRTVGMLERAYIDPLFAFPPRMNDDAKETLEAMQDRVGKIGLISNTGHSPGVALRKLLEQLGILRFFDVTIFSDEAGCRKPRKRIFDLSAKELGAEPRKIIHIGDNPEADIWGAKQAGMYAVLFDYPVPEGFKRQRGSLFALSRADRHVPDSEIRPDARISSLKDALGFVDSLG
jgi:putative hydrolase of the HAD superfamily